ncbi:MAG TPA: ADOP family duplicated permease [Gemmatimonadales bacterium]|nr:ADOP family duplicated permease [Gemmatimonadales bacterium]
MTRPPSLLAWVSARVHHVTRWIFRRGRMEAELAEELRFHMDQEVEEQLAHGVPPQDAAARAHRRFGSPAQIADETRDEWHIAAADRLGRDLKYGVRMLARSPGLTLVAIGTLGLGIGATTALFGLLDTVRFRNVPAPHPEQLYAVERTGPGDNLGESVSALLFRGLESGPPVLGDLAGYSFRVDSLAGESDSVVTQLTSDHWFDVVGVRPVGGTAWLPANPGESPPLAAVISDRLWHRRFGASTDAIGRTLMLDGRSLTVTGIMPPGFTGISLEYPVDIWVPLALQPQFDGASRLTDGSLNWIRVVTRLRATDGGDAAEAAASLLLARLRQDGAVTSDSAERMALVPAAHPELRGRDEVARTLFLFTLLAAAVLGIACANVANLQLARGVARRRELTVRLSLGASRARLVAQLLTESILLAFAGGAVGLVLSGGIRRLLLTIAAPATSGRTTGLAVPLDAWLFVFAAGLSILVALAAGLAPALGATRLDISSRLRESALSVTNRTGRRALRSLLVGQLAVSLILLTAAGMAGRALRDVETLDLGFEHRNLVQMSVDWRGFAPAQTRADATAMLDRLRNFPGVTGASLSNPAAFGRSTFSTTAYHVAPDYGTVPHSVELASVSANFFSTLRIPILRGRAFSEGDREGAPNVVVVNQPAARLFFPGEDPLGKRFAFMGPDRMVEIVGIAGATRPHSATADPPAIVYSPIAQDPPGLPLGELSLEMRMQGGVPSLDRLVALQGVGSGLVVRAGRVDDLLSQSLALQRLSAVTTAALGIAGLCLAMIGLYGLNAYLVAKRTTETGIRLALGATPQGVRWLVWRQSMVPVVIGLALGVTFSALTAMVFRSAVFGLSRPDPAVVAAVAIMMIGAAALACYLPALRASRLNPAVALRAE